MLESDFWRLLKTNLKREFLMTRVESVSSPGVPDVYWTSLRDEGVSGWIELKIVRGNVVKLRPEQVLWILRHSQLNVNAKIMARKNDTIYLWEGKDVSIVAEQGLRSDASVLTFEKPWNWNDIIHRIKVGFEGHGEGPLPVQPGDGEQEAPELRGEDAVRDSTKRDQRTVLKGTGDKEGS